MRKSRNSLEFAYSLDRSELRRNDRRNGSKDLGLLPPSKDAHQFDIHEKDDRKLPDNDANVRVDSTFRDALRRRGLLEILSCAEKGDRVPLTDRGEVARAKETARLKALHVLGNRHERKVASENDMRDGDDF